MKNVLNINENFIMYILQNLVLVNVHIFRAINSDRLQKNNSQSNSQNKMMAFVLMLNIDEVFTCSYSSCSATLSLQYCCSQLEQLTDCNMVCHKPVSAHITIEAGVGRTPTYLTCSLIFSENVGLYTCKYVYGPQLISL